MCLLLVIVFFIDGRIQWKAYSLIYFVAFVLAFGCILTLILHYVDVAKTSKQLPWIKLVRGHRDDSKLLVVGQLLKKKLNV